jgi:hypothetical protein
LPPEPHIPSSTDSRREKEKELRRVYRKLKGVRSELSVKMRKLRTESSRIESDTEDISIHDEDLEADFHENSRNVESSEARMQTTKRPAIDMAQYEVKSLIEHKNRLRKRFWKLQEEARKKK